MKTEEENKKDRTLYEAIYDCHLRKIYNPYTKIISECIIIIVTSIFFEAKYMILIYIIWCLIENITTRILYLHNAIEMLQLKNGLISMFPFDYNPFIKSCAIKVEFDDYYSPYDVESSERIKKVVYKIEDKIIYSQTHSIEDKSEEDIKSDLSWFKQRFMDYIKYLPREILFGEVTQEELDIWFTYLDDVRANF